MSDYLQEHGKVLCIRSTPANRVSHGGFVWPESGPVECPDWDAKQECGNGLHALLWGEGSSELLCWYDDAVFQVVAVDPGEIVDLGGKVKFPHGEVVFSGPAKDAGDFLSSRCPAGKSPVLGTATAGYRGTATAGYRGTATAGDRGTATAGDLGTATAGYRGTATAGDRGTATAGDLGTATAGYLGTATAGYLGTATAGYLGTATAGYRGTATAGCRGTATAGCRGTATAGYRGTATAGYLGTATAGDEGVLVIEHWNGKRFRLRAVEVDGEKIKPNTPYQLNDAGEFVEVTDR